MPLLRLAEDANTHQQITQAAYEGEHGDDFAERGQKRKMVDIAPEIVAMKEQGDTYGSDTQGHRIRPV